MKGAVDAQLLGCLFGVTDISRGLEKEKNSMLYKLVQEKRGKFEMWNYNLERLPELIKFAQETIKLKANRLKVKYDLFMQE